MIGALQTVNAAPTVHEIWTMSPTPAPNPSTALTTMEELSTVYVTIACTRMLLMLLYLGFRVLMRVVVKCFDRASIALIFTNVYVQFLNGTESVTVFLKLPEVNLKLYNCPSRQKCWRLLL